MGMSNSRVTATGGGSVVVGGVVVVVVVVVIVVSGAAVVAAGSAAAPVHAAAVNAIAQTTMVMGKSRTGSDVSAGRGLSCKRVRLRYYPAVLAGWTAKT